MATNTVTPPPPPPGVSFIDEEPSPFQQSVRAVALPPSTASFAPAPSQPFAKAAVPIEYDEDVDPRAFTLVQSMVGLPRSPIRVGQVQNVVPRGGEGQAPIGAILVTGAPNPKLNGYWTVGGRKLSNRQEFRETGMGAGGAGGGNVQTATRYYTDPATKERVLIQWERGADGVWKPSQFQGQSFGEAPDVVITGMDASGEPIFARRSSVGQPGAPSPKPSATDIEQEAQQQASNWASEAKQWGFIRPDLDTKEGRYLNYPKAIWRLRMNPNIKDENVRRRALKLLEDEYNTAAQNEALAGRNASVFKIMQVDEFERQQKAAAPPVGRSVPAPSTPVQQAGRPKLKRIQ